jgi:hypothetical protein
MNYELIKCVIAGQIERIRGEESITVPVTCTFKVGNRQYEVIGVSSANKVANIAEAIPEAVKNAEANLSALFKFSSAPSEAKPNQNLTKVMKLAVTPVVEDKIKKCKVRDEYNQMMEPAGEHQQQKITGLCEALGIDIIDVLEDKWTSVEVLVLINYLEKMTESFTV